MTETKRYKWTIMVYLGGDNNLSEEMLWALTEMRSANRSDDVAVVAQFDPRGQAIPPQRYVINPSDERIPLISAAKLIPAGPHAEGTGFEEAVKKFKIEDIFAGIHDKRNHPENSGNPWTLLQFIYWAADEYPAHHYMVVLSGHGSGADEDFLLNDTTPRDSLTIHELQKVFAAVRQIEIGGRKSKIDILGMDSCLMSTAEVFYQLRNDVNFLVTAEGFELNSGWPYRQILDALVGLVNKGEAEPSSVAKTIVKEYIDYYSDYALAGQSVDLSACEVEDNKKNQKLAPAIKRLSEVLSDALSGSDRARDAILLAHWEAQSYKFDQYVDLRDFCEILRQRYGDFKSVCDEVINAVDRVCRESGYVGPGFQYSNGLSIYFPWAHIALRYGDLDLSKDTGWHAFLEKYVAATRRHKRRGCEFARGSIEDKLHNPKADDFIERPEIPGSFRSSPPDNKGLGRARGMKNFPIDWC